MKRLSVFLILLLSLTAALAQTADDQYVQIFSGIQAADTLNENARSADALAKYLEAQTALQRFQKGYPGWNPGIVSFRLGYINGKIAELRSKLPGGATPPVNETTPTPAPDPIQVQRQLSALSEQVRQLQADRSILEAKLREALSIQPAAKDPRELAKAEEQIKKLQKENDLLQVVLDQEKAKPASADPKALDQMKLALTEANTKLAQEAERSAALDKEKQELKKRLDTLIPNGWNEASIEKTTKELDAANQQIADQKELLLRLKAEKEALQARLKDAGKESDSVAALKAENELLKKQLAARGSVTANPEAAGTQLAQAQAQVAALQSDKDMLRLEKSALETRVKQLQAGAPKDVITPFSSQPNPETKRVQQLERDKEDLQKKLDTANKQLASVSRKKGESGVVQQLQNEIVGLNSRLGVLEAQKVPYSAEELALFKARPGSLAASEVRKPVSQLPAGSTELVAEAQRHFSARQFDKAEENYQEILKKDEKNPLTLANLAAIQLERNRLPEAEQNAAKAVAQAPEDAFSLQILGQAKFRQKDFDGALDALSRAAKLDPSNATVQNSLGLVLSEKGMRGPAETALRKAIQLQPNYGEAHNNLAVIYLSQKPPLLELARWHYQKAVAAGTSNPSLLQMLEIAEKGAAK